MESGVTNGCLLVVTLQTIHLITPQLVLGTTLTGVHDHCMLFMTPDGHKVAILNVSKTLRLPLSHSCTQYHYQDNTVTDYIPTVSRYVIIGFIKTTVCSRSGALGGGGGGGV